MDVSIIGGSGYGGGELLRILLQHPEVRVKQVTSRRFAGHPVAHVHPNLRSLARLDFCRPDDLSPCDLLFVGLPNGESMRVMPGLMNLAPKIIDLGADFRLRSPELWKSWYGFEHAAPELMGRFVTGIPEILDDRIRGADLVAGPGCEAVAAILGLYPPVRRGLILPAPVIIDAKMGSSQSGSASSSASHHPERAGAVRTYRPAGHRHAAEIEQLLGGYIPNLRVDITATAVEMVRGALATIHVYLRDGAAEKEIWAAYRQDYAGRPFVRLVKQASGLYRMPEPKILQGTNFCEIGFALDPRCPRLVIVSAIDNLVKGTAGNAVQCMNLMCGFPETAGLGFPGLHPV